MLGRGSQSSGGGRPGLEPAGLLRELGLVPGRPPCATTLPLPVHPVGAPQEKQRGAGPGRPLAPKCRPDSVLRALDLQSVLGSVELMSKRFPQGVPHSPSQGLPGKTALLFQLILQKVGCWGVGLGDYWTWGCVHRPHLTSSPLKPAH